MDKITKAAFQLAKINPEFRGHLVNELKKMAAAQPSKRQVLSKKTDIRKPFYQALDGIGSLADVVKESKDLKSDTKLQALTKKIEKDLDEIYNYLNAHYVWD